VNEREVKLEMRRRAHAEDDPHALHERFLAVMRSNGHPWWNSEANLGRLNLGGELECQVDVSKAMSGGATASLAYVHRGSDYIQDRALFDDRFMATVRVDQDGYSTLVNRRLQAFLHAFEPYRAQLILDEDLALADWDAAIATNATTGKDEDGRDGMIRLWPVSFFDDELCRRALGVSPEVVTNRLVGRVERIERCVGGTLIVATSSLLDADGVIATDRNIRTSLGEL
jgi:hypothetical protein